MMAGRRFRAARHWVAQQLRPKVILALLVILGLAAVLLWQARGIGQYEQNLALNLGADLVGAIVIIFVVSPLITRGQQGRVREHPRLDYDWFTDQVYQATSAVRVLDTFSGLFDRPGTQRFFRIVRDTLTRHATVRILLLNPDSLAAEQRASELGGVSRADIRREILRNLHALDRFARSLDESLRQRFEVRLYDASASVTFYRWDDRALVSFLPIGRLSGDGVQLEITVTSPLGTFVSERFDELWEHGTRLTDFMTLELSIRDRVGVHQYECPFIGYVGELYVSDSRVLARIAGARDERLHASLRGEMTFGYGLDVVSGESDVHTSLVAIHLEKYGRPADVFIHVRPHAD
jgi:hypothetical protein